VLVGLDNSGKSTLLQTILGAAPEKTMPTFGFNNESMNKAGFDIDLFDLGGGKRIRGGAVQVGSQLDPQLVSAW
jgi:GTPase SAR1 family protein